ncbi:MAG: ribosome silencing factor [Polaromonas sp.]|nr:ribosome silencing factor [Polaromonas sp.]
MTSSADNTSSAAAKKDIQKLQRAIVDGLEDVKGTDIQVFDTEHITSLFERVIIASGTSNRQTKALAASVRDAVREAGFGKPRIEGEENGEWIIVDCGAAVAHIMQPTIRQYYHLEELWGDKPIKLKLGAPAPLVKASKPEPAEPAGAARAKPGAKKAAGKTPARGTASTASALAALKGPDSSYVGRVGKTNDWTAKRNATATAAEPVEKKPRATAKTAAVKTAKPDAKTAAKPAVKTPIYKVPVTKKVAAKKVAAKVAVKAAAKTAAKSAAKPAAKKPAARKTPSRSA